MVRRSCSVNTPPTSAEPFEELKARGCVREVADAADLVKALAEDLNDPEAAASRGAAARSFVLAQNGAAERTLFELDRLVESAVAEKLA